MGSSLYVHVIFTNIPGCPMVSFQRLLLHLIADTSDFFRTSMCASPHFKHIWYTFPSPGHDPWVQSYQWSSSQALIIIALGLWQIFTSLFFGATRPRWFYIWLWGQGPWYSKYAPPFQKSHLCLTMFPMTISSCQCDWISNLDFSCIFEVQTG